MYILSILIFSLISCSKNENSESDSDPLVKKLTQMSFGIFTDGESNILTNKFFYSDNKLKSIVTESSGKYADSNYGESDNDTGLLINWELIYNTDNTVILNSAFSERYEDDEETVRQSILYI